MYLHKIRRSINSSQILHFAFIFQTVVNISSEFISTIWDFKNCFGFACWQRGRKGRKIKFGWIYPCIQHKKLQKKIDAHDFLYLIFNLILNGRITEFTKNKKTGIQLEPTVGWNRRKRWPLTLSILSWRSCDLFSISLRRLSSDLYWSHIRWSSMHLGRIESTA